MRRVLGDGLTMVTLDELQAQLGMWVNDEALRKWHTRHGLHRVKLDGVWWYHLEGAIEADYLTDGRGRPRGNRRDMEMGTTHQAKVSKAEVVITDTDGTTWTFKLAPDGDEPVDLAVAVDREAVEQAPSQGWRVFEAGPAEASVRLRGRLMMASREVTRG